VNADNHRAIADLVHSYPRRLDAGDLDVGDGIAREGRGMTVAGPAAARA